MVFVAALILSLVVASRRYSLVGVCGLLIAVASSCRARALGVPGSHGLSCSPAPGIFPDQGLNPYPLHWEVNSYSLLYQGQPVPCFRCCNPALLDAGTFWSCVVTGPLGPPTCLRACRLDSPRPPTLLLFGGVDAPLQTRGLLSQSRVTSSSRNRLLPPGSCSFLQAGISGISGTLMRKSEALLLS